MLCIRPLIELYDARLIKKYGKKFISYKHFDEKKQMNALLSSGKIKCFPCRSCLPCVNMGRYHWVQKLELEKQCWKYCYFITLTYNDDHLPYELQVKDFQKFIKYLRNVISPYEDIIVRGRKIRKYDYSVNPIRYFACGEYGTKTKRPHYHAILFTNYQFELVYVKNTKNGVLFKCDLMDKAWMNKGYIWVAHDLDSASFSYVSMYSNKQFLKQSQNLAKKKIFNEIDNIRDDPNIKGFNKLCMMDFLIENLHFKKNEFILCSKCPPLGSYKAQTNITKAPSSLLKWVENDMLKKLNDVKSEHLQNKYHKELKKRQYEYDEFIKHHDIYDIVENNKIMTDKHINSHKSKKNII